MSTRNPKQGQYDEAWEQAFDDMEVENARKKMAELKKAQDALDLINKQKAEAAWRKAQEAIR